MYGGSKYTLYQDGYMFYHVNPPETSHTSLITIDLSHNSPPYNIPIGLCVRWRAMLGLNTLIDEALKLRELSFPNCLNVMTLNGADVCEDVAVSLSSDEPEDKGQWTPQE
jgi:hypothetical protein